MYTHMLLSIHSYYLQDVDQAAARAKEQAREERSLLQAELEKLRGKLQDSIMFKTYDLAYFLFQTYSYITITCFTIIRFAII